MSPGTEIGGGKARTASTNLFRSSLMRHGPKTNMVPLSGWSVKGERLEAIVPYNNWKAMTLLAALRVGGIIAPCIFDGPINGVSFQRYIER